MKRLLSVATILMAASTMSVAAQAKESRPPPAYAGNWVRLGTTHAKFTGDHDAIDLRGRNDNFRAIKFRVSDAPLNMKRMVVTYDNGARDNIDIRQKIAKGGESRAIDLRGAGRRSLRRIEFWYDTKGIFKGTADVTVWGLK